MSTELIENPPESAETRTPGDGAIKQDRAKYRQILDGAARVFEGSGFDGASMNDIARAAGVSKGTLYVYFPSKEALFEALVVERRREQAEQLCRFPEGESVPAEVLRRFGLDLVTMMTQPSHLAQTRMVIAVAEKFPQIGRTFYEAGPRHGVLALARYVAAQAERGALDVEDAELAACQFVDMCKSREVMRAMFRYIERADPAELARNVDAAVKVFLAAYGRKGADAA
ncbi:MAG: TetR/AcrR family transcriptional regulator [Hyphomicrobiales bacterium]|nr:TetR/AcrR family transcriptional regulator [Hyphomicrobiales bacterium]